VTIEECDPLTFRALLIFLYSDALDKMDAWIAEKAWIAENAWMAEKAEKAAATSSTESGGDGATAEDANSSSSALISEAAATRISLLQRVLAVSHRYQVARLQLWCEGQLAELVSVGTVCASLCQAHMYEAKQLEEACLDFIFANHTSVSVTPDFGALSAEWPEVMLKVVHKLSGVEQTEAAAAIEAATAYYKKRTKRKRAASSDQ